MKLQKLIKYFNIKIKFTKKNYCLSTNLLNNFDISNSKLILNLYDLFIETTKLLRLKSKSFCNNTAFYHKIVFSIQTLKNTSSLVLKLTVNYKK